jgi:hypothetical protein
VPVQSGGYRGAKMILLKWLLPTRASKSVFATFPSTARRL